MIISYFELYSGRGKIMNPGDDGYVKAKHRKLREKTIMWYLNEGLGKIQEYGICLIVVIHVNMQVMSKFGKLGFARRFCRKPR